MAQTRRTTKLDSRTARANLPARHAPYWQHLDRGQSLGYRKGAKGGMWIARLRADEGKEAWLTIGAADDHGDTGLDYREAKRAAVDWFARKAREALGGDEAVDAYTVGHALDAYLKWFRLHRKSVRDTERAIEAHVRPALGAIEVAKLTAKKIRTWHEALAEAPPRLRTRRGAETLNTRPVPTDNDGKRSRRATANRVLTILKAALNYVFQEGKVASDDAWRRAKPFRGADAARLRYLQRDECQRLLNACPAGFREMVQAALLSGCRYGELCRLRVDDFSRDAGTLRIAEAKSGKPRHVPLDAEGRAFFEALAIGRPADAYLLTRGDGKPWGKAHQVRPLAEACEAARIEPAANFHCLRHTWASHRVMAGAPLLVVAQVLGHADTRMVEKHYGHLGAGYVRDVIDRTGLGLGIAAGNVRAIV
ncbi:Integrase family protein [Candidatus Defluviicoccus seviourii]|uniref:Integrase family protein n=2 Tax=root TaxID=1 RepID=A0A564WGE9_9PROT|nr:Integrase family protein [uncultured Defluviicoccus sp.]VUX47078.1 Integrase family protein [Candidatus Defluviicoccus seviourii]